MVYPKIPNVYCRDENGQPIEGEFPTPEIEYLANSNWVFTEKVDGTNIRIIIDPYDGVQIKGRHETSGIPKFLLEKLKELFNEDSLADFLAEGNHTVLYGEGYGNRIQKVGKMYNPRGVDFILFDIRENSTWLKRSEVHRIAESLGIDVVPTVGCGTLKDGVEMVKRGLKSRWGTFTAEGIVATPEVPLLDRNKNRIMTKIKTRDFCMYHNEHGSGKGDRPRPCFVPSYVKDLRWKLAFGFISRDSFDRKMDEIMTMQTNTTRRFQEWPVSVQNLAEAIGIKHFNRWDGHCWLPANAPFVGDSIYQLRK